MALSLNKPKLDNLASDIWKSAERLRGKFKAYEFARKLAIPSVQPSNLNSTRYCRMLIPVPPLHGQHAIYEYLGDKVGELSRVVCCIELQISTLTAYRKSLIHECVTGQRRVSEADLSGLIDTKSAEGSAR